MSDTIELLETIGSDASLRHAPEHELLDLLKRAKASAPLQAAVASGDSARLSAEFGIKPNLAPQISNAPGHEEEEEPEQEQDAEQTASLQARVPHAA